MIVSFVILSFLFIVYCLPSPLSLSLSLCYSFSLFSSLLSIVVIIIIIVYCMRFSVVSILPQSTRLNYLATLHSYSTQLPFKLVLLYLLLCTTNNTIHFSSSSLFVIVINNKYINLFLTQHLFK